MQRDNMMDQLIIKHGTATLGPFVSNNQTWDMRSHDFNLIGSGFYTQTSSVSDWF